MSATVAGPRAIRSLFVWGCYLTGLSLALLVAPNTLLVAFQLPPTDDVWIRVVGMLTAILTLCSFMAARTANAEYMRWSVVGRGSVPFFLSAFVLLGFAGPALLPFGLIDLAGASWTWWALRRDAAV